MNIAKAIISSILLSVTVSAFASPEGSEYSGTTVRQRQDKQFEDYVSKLRDAYDISITKPDNFSIADIRGRENIERNINPDWRTSVRYNRSIAAAIIEADNEEAAFILPRLNETELLLPPLRNAAQIELELRNSQSNMDLDINPLITIIADADMSRYAEADTAVIYEFDFQTSVLGRYNHCIGIYLRKAAYPALLLKVALNDKGYEKKDEYVRLILDNIRYGSSPDQLMVYEENAANDNDSEFVFPNKFRTYTGILPSINDETLEEINRRKAWLDAHGMTTLPELSEDALDALNHSKVWRERRQTTVDSINQLDIPYSQRLCPTHVLERLPHFPADHPLVAKDKWIKENMKYPADARKKGIQGMVILDFTVLSDGSIEDITVREESSDNASLRKEAVRLLKSMPKWIPAKYDGHEVCARAHSYFYFVLPAKERAKIALKVKASDADADNNIYSDVMTDIRAEYPGGEEAMNKWISENINYTDEIIEAVKQDQFKSTPVSFTIGRDGSVENPHSQLNFNRQLALEAMRVVGKMPKWIPAFKNGKPVASRHDIIVNFVIPSEE